MSFSGLTTVTASTKRNPAAVAGVVGVPVTKLTSLSVLPPMPVSPQIVELYRLHSPRESFVTYADGAPDVLEGDELTISTTTYRVRAVGEWPTDRAFVEIVLERVKGT